MICKHCNTDKPASDFYISNKTKCKECVKASVTKNRLEKIEHYRAFDKARASMPNRVAARSEYQRTDGGKEAMKRARMSYKTRKPERRAAHVALGNAVRDGRVIPWPVCAIPECNDKPHGHHPDYSAPLDVVWLCPKHHKEAHAMAI